MDELPDHGANPDEHVWKYLGEKVLVEEGDLPYAALSAVIASLSVYLAATEGLGADELDAALGDLADVVGELRTTSGWTRSGHTFH